MNRFTRALIAVALVLGMSSVAQAGALGAARATNSKNLGPLKRYLMKASTTIYAGGMVMIDSNGLALPAQASASNHGVVGVATEGKVSGSSGSYYITVQEGWFKFDGTTLGQEDVGNPVYAEDDADIDDAAGANEPVAGILVEYVSASSGWVNISSTITARYLVTSDPLTLTGDLTLSGAAGAITIGTAASTVLLNSAADNSATGLCIGSTGALSTVCVDSTNSAEGLAVTGYESVSGLLTATGGLSTTKPLFVYDRIRFCGNGSNGGTAWYDGPVLYSDSPTDFSIGSAACDGNDSATESTADRPFDAYTTIKVVGMACVTQAGGAADTNTFQLRSATANVTGVTCAVTNDGASPKTCSVILSAPVTITAGATLAVKNTQSGTDDMSAKDMGCWVYYTY